MFTKIERKTVDSWLPDLIASVEVKHFDNGAWSSAKDREHEKEALTAVLDDLLTEIRQRGFTTRAYSGIEVGDMYLDDSIEHFYRD